jgi:ankyrin repeat protein
MLTIKENFFSYYEQALKSCSDSELDIDTAILEKSIKEALDNLQYDKALYLSVHFNYDKYVDEILQQPLEKSNASLNLLWAFHYNRTEITRKLLETGATIIFTYKRIPEIDPEIYRLLDFYKKLQE